MNRTDETKPIRPQTREGPAAADSRHRTEPRALDARDGPAGADDRGRTPPVSPDRREGSAAADSRHRTEPGALDARDGPVGGFRQRVRARGKPPDTGGSPPPENAGPAAARKKKGLRLIVYFLLRLGIVTAVIVFVFTYMIDIRVQHGMSMYPHLKDGDLLISYKLDTYKTGDAVVYRDPKSGEARISRILAHGTNEVMISEAGDFLLNGTRTETEIYEPTLPVESGGISYPYRMSENGYFLLNDRRTSGRDSRLFGELREEDFLGKVVYVFRRRGI